MTCVSHPLIRPECIEERRYQLAIALRALDANTMVVLPTGLGKTAVALLVAASRLRSHQGKVLVLAPTKPLVEQHLRFFKTVSCFFEDRHRAAGLRLCHVHRGDLPRRSGREPGRPAGSVLPPRR